VEALVRKAFQETVRQKIRGWNTAIIWLEHEYCGDGGPPRADLAIQIEKLVAKRRAATLVLFELGQPLPNLGAPPRIPQ
jgi:hypothetical protein